jgi:small-conductance mechanosensitive channel
MIAAHSSDTPSFHGKNIFLFFFAVVLLLYSVHTYQSWQQHREQNKVEMKSSGKNGKHANPKARQSADEKYREAKTEFEQLNSKVNKTPEEKAALEKWRTQMKHWQKKKDWGGEQHSQKHKGN